MSNRRKIHRIDPFQKLLGRHGSSFANQLILKPIRWWAHQIVSSHMRYVIKTATPNLLPRRIAGK